METHPLDIAAKQVVRWLLDEDRAGQHRLQISASRQYLPEEIPTLEQSRLGDVEGDDISEIAAVGILEVTPMHTAVRVRIEDTLGRRMPDDASASSQPGFNPKRAWVRSIIALVTSTSSEVRAGVASTSTMMARSLSIK